ncbi:MAG TPA: maleylpyruvate isomerase family mycothiol-dependent enzyme [Acidimicrobiales bacterium]|nr:maleylpyruvate isomerase family mycothiol-dependent enzyme [Acidimicrobiales bacterium]
MNKDLDSDPALAASLCAAAHRRLEETAAGLDDETVRQPSRLPGWTIAHVLTHLARNADGHARRLEGSLRGEELARYPGGREQRARDIEAGAGRVAAEISGDVAASAARLEETWTACLEAGWPHRDLRAGDEYPTTSIPVRRLREVEMHHLDLGLRYRIADWPPEYVAWELPQILATVPGRVKELSDARSLVAWLSGRGPVPTAIGLEDW